MSNRKLRKAIGAALDGRISDHYIKSAVTAILVELKPYLRCIEACEEIAEEKRELIKHGDKRTICHWCRMKEYHDGGCPQAIAQKALRGL